MAKDEPRFHVTRPFSHCFFERISRRKVERKLGESISNRSRLEIELGPTSPAVSERLVVFAVAEIEFFLSDRQNYSLLTVLGFCKITEIKNIKYFSLHVI